LDLDLLGWLVGRSGLAPERETVTPGLEKGLTHLCDCPALRPPPSSTSALVRSKRQKFICYTDRQLQQAKFICKPWSLSVSELQLTAPANAGVQKAKSVCKPWSLLMSELHTYFVEKRYTESVVNPVVKERLLRLFSGV